MADMTDAHRRTTKALSLNPTISQEIRDLASAIVNLNEWMDGSFNDRKKLFAAVKSLEERLDSIESRISVVENSIRLLAAE
jgi:hypothetical protein